MQQRPSASELITDIAELLEAEVVAALDGPLQHRVRVAASLARIVARELQLGPTADDDERHRLGLVLGRDGAELLELRTSLVARLADPAPLGAPAERALYDALMATARADLAIAKPGYADWVGAE